MSAAARTGLLALTITGLAAADTPSAAEILDKVALTYSHLSSIHVTAKESESFLRGGQNGYGETVVELSALGRDRYYVRMKFPGADAFAMSDGSATWKALASKKEWTRIDAASMQDGDAAPNQTRSDLYGSIAENVFSQYPNVNRVLKDPEIVKDDTYKLGSEKLPCFVVRARVPNAIVELWIDKDRYQVVQRHQITTTAGTRTEVWIKDSALELNPKLPDSTFQFEPAKGWHEVEGLTLPGENHLNIGVRAAPFVLKSLEGEQIDLAAMRGKVVVLDFWATWCPPCREELPTIEKLRKEFAGDVQILGVNDEEASTVKGFVKSKHYELTVLMDSGRKVHRQYLVSAIPTLAIIDRQGVLRELFVGSRSEAMLRKAIQGALNQ